MNNIYLFAGLCIFPAIYFLLKKILKNKTEWVFKGLSLFLALCVFFVINAQSKPVFAGTFNLTLNAPFDSPFVNFLIVNYHWFYFASAVILQIYPFFKKFSVLKNYGKTFCLITSCLLLGCVQQVSKSFTGSYDMSLCGAFLGLSIALMFEYSLYLFLTDGFFKMSKKEGLEMLFIAPIILIASIPPYLLQTLFGVIGPRLVNDFHLYHRIWLYIFVFVLVVLYLHLKNTSKEYSRMILLYISLTTLISYLYDYEFKDFITPTSWPLHLCNTAMFIVPICLLFHLNKVYYFTLFINVLGAFLAMVMPDLGDEASFVSTACVRFWINHICAFSMPVWMILLKVYERPKIKEFVYSNIGFFAYYVFILFMNGYLTNYKASIDFFFINSDFIADKLGDWAENLFNNFILEFDIGTLHFKYHPVYQLIYYLVYVAFAGAMWFLYVFLFQIQDKFIDLSNKNKKMKLDQLALEAKYNTKEASTCMDENSVNKLVVTDCGKRYGNSKTFSTRHISFEVDSGEILGFLGPNGAGKSTTIKCIVGIQPPTEGSISINGYDIEKQPVMAKRQLGFVPDHYALYEKLTGREYINYIADLYDVSKEDRDNRLTKLLQDLSMEQNIDNPIRTYSHGMKQKIAIMSALIHNPKLWILDEPLTGLDPNSIFEVKECMRNHAKEGNIVFFSSHIIDLVEKLCDRIIIINHGKVVASTKLEELKEKGIALEQYYLSIINEEKQEDDSMNYTDSDGGEEKSDTRFFQVDDKIKEKQRIKAEKKAAKKLAKENGETQQVNG